MIRVSAFIAVFIALATLVIAGCSGAPTLVPPTPLRFSGETVAIQSDRCSYGNHHAKAATVVAESMFVRTGAVVIEEPRTGWFSRRRPQEPRTLNASVCASLVPDGNYMAHVVIRITDTSGAVRYLGDGRVEYRQSGRQNTVCAWREIERSRVVWKRDGFHEVIDPDLPRCPATPEEAIGLAAQNAFNSLQKY